MSLKKNLTDPLKMGKVLPTQRQKMRLDKNGLFPGENFQHVVFFERHGYTRGLSNTTF